MTIFPLVPLQRLAVLLVAAAASATLFGLALPPAAGAQTVHADGGELMRQCAMARRHPALHHQPCAAVLLPAARKPLPISITSTPLGRAPECPVPTRP